MGVSFWVRVCGKTWTDLCVGHVDHAVVAFCSADMGEADSRVSSGSLDDCPAGLESMRRTLVSTGTLEKWDWANEQAELFSIADETEGSTVLHAAAWVLKFSFAVDVGASSFREALEIDLRVQCVSPGNGGVG